MKKEAFLQIVRSNAKTALSEQENAMFGSIGDAIEKAFAEDSIERGKQIEKVTTQLGLIPEGETMAQIVRALASKVDEVEDKAVRKLSDSDKFKLKRALEAKKDEILAVANRRSQAPWALEFSAMRAASALMTTSTVLTGAAAINTTNVFDDVEVTVIRYPKNFILDAISSRQVAKVPESIKWKEQIVSNDGVPAVVAEGNTKPLVDLKFSWEYAYRKKYAGRIEFTEETEIDFEQLMLDIVNMFEGDVLRKYNAGVLADILAWAPAYAGTALDDQIVKPTIINVVNAGKLQLASAEYMADLLVINPSDYAETQNMQSTTGEPIFVPDSVLFPGLSIYVTNAIAAGTCLLAEGSIIKEQHGAFQLRSGLYGNQFIENEKTIIGELFSVLKLPTESKKGVVKLVVATVKAALLKP